MTEHPPPAPDWILGEDGHWKPPPFQVGGRPTAPPPTAPPLTAPPAAAPPGVPPIPPAGSWPPGPGSGPMWAPPPPLSTGPSAGRVVAWVVGGFAVAGIAVVGILVTAVTFLGTTAEPEARFTPVGSSLPDDGDDDGGGFTPVGGDDEADDPAGGDDEATPIPPGADPVVTGSMAASEQVVADLTGDWILNGVDEPAVDESQDGACVAEGWLSGATDRFRTYFDRPGGPVTDALTLSVTAYADEEAARAELDRARSQAYQDCELLQYPELVGATITALPDDPQAPGVAYEITEPDGPRTEYDITIVVGAVRAHLDFCGCADLGLDGQQAVARQVAAAVATAQGLPAPG
jgi:hypothetical protein